MPLNSMSRKMKIVLTKTPMNFWQAKQELQPSTKSKFNHNQTRQLVNNCRNRFPSPVE